LCHWEETIWKLKRLFLTGGGREEEAELSEALTAYLLKGGGGCT